MEIIRQLYGVIRTFSSRKNPAKTYLLKPGSSSSNLLDCIMSDRFGNEDEIAEFLFPEDSPNKSKYRQSKHALMRKLEMLLMFLNFENATELNWQKKLYKVRRDLLIAELMRWTRNFAAAHYFVKRALKIAEKFDFTNERISCYEKLNYYYASRSDHDAYSRNDRKLVNALEKYSAEQHCRRWFTRLRLELQQRAELPEHILDEFQAALPLLDADRLRFKSEELHLYHAEISAQVFSQQENFTDAVRVFEELREFLAANPVTFNKWIPGLTYSRLSRINLCLREFEEAEKYAESALQASTVNSFNWFLAVQEYIIACLHSRNYRRATELFSTALQQSNFRNRESSVRLKTHGTFEAYLRLFLDDDALLPRDVTVWPEYSPLNIVPDDLEIPRDIRAGMYLSAIPYILIHYLKQRMFELVESRLQSAGYYIKKYSRSETVHRRFPRLQCFIQLFGVMVDCEYQYDATVNTSAPLLAKLTSLYQKAGGSDDQIEFAPFHHVWEVALQELQKIEAEGIFTRPR